MNHIKNWWNKPLSWKRLIAGSLVMSIPAMVICALEYRALVRPKDVEDLKENETGEIKE